MSFEEWLDKYAEGGVHLKGLSPKEYGQAIWAHMSAVNDKLEEQLEEAESVLSRIYEEDRTTGKTIFKGEVIKEHSSLNTSAILAEQYFRNKGEK